MDGADRDFDLYEVQSDGGGNSEGDPVEVLLHDRVLMALCVVYGIVMIGMLYFGA